jgi:hypothetical protein
MSQQETEQSNDDDLSLDGAGVIDVSGIEGKVVDSAEAATEPGRNIDHITAVFNKVRHGDQVKVVFGTSSFKTSISGEVVGIKGPKSSRPPDAGWTKTIEVRGPEGDDEKGRLYRMGAGGNKADPWLIYSYQYYPELDMLELEDAELHGWIIDVQRVPEEW